MAISRLPCDDIRALATANLSDRAALAVAETDEEVLVAKGNNSQRKETKKPKKEGAKGSKKDSKKK